MHRFQGAAFAGFLLISVSVAQNSDGVDKALTLAPNLGWTTGTQQQTIFGGSALLSAVRSKFYCDPHLEQFGMVATASDSTTTKLGGKPTYLDSNDVTLDATFALPGNGVAKSYLGGDADFFENNSLGVGLQQIYAAKYRYYFRQCPKPGSGRADERPPGQRWFASVGAGVGYMRQRLYSTANESNAAVLPLTAQLSFLQGGGKKEPPKLLWYFIAGYMPALTDSHAYQLSAIAGVQIPTRIPNLKLNFSDSDLYMENAPAGHRRNYQNGTVSLQFTLASKVSAAGDDIGACYGGDKLQRLYCYDEVTAASCSPPNLFRRGGFCSSINTSLKDTLKTDQK